MTSRFAELGIPSKEWTEFYRENHKNVPDLVGSPDHLRRVMRDLKARAAEMVSPITDGLVVRDVQMPTSDNSSISLRLYEPEVATELRPVIIYIHGGGWTLGDLDGEDGTCRAICTRCSAVVVSVDYRLAPEFPFPRGLDDSWEALRWVSDNSDSLRIMKDSIILAGSSSGANQTAVLTHRARDVGFHIRGQILRIPSVCHIECYPPELGLHSMEELKDGPLLLKRSMELFYSYYNAPDPSNPEVSPLLAPDFTKLPPAYLQIAGMDPLRDEGFAYADKLRRAGNNVIIDVYAGLPHAFGYFPDLPSSRKNADDLCKAINKILS